MYARGISYKSGASDVTSLEGTATGDLCPAPISPVRSYYADFGVFGNGLKSADSTLLASGHTIVMSVKCHVPGGGAAPYSSAYGGTYATQINNGFDALLTSGYLGQIIMCFQHEINAKAARNSGGDDDAMKAWCYFWDQYDARRIAKGKAVGSIKFVIIYADFGIGTRSSSGVEEIVNGNLGQAGTLYPDATAISSSCNRPETVDYVGYDPYNFSGTEGGGTFDSTKWHDLVDHGAVALDFGGRKGRPVMFPEVNCIEDPRTGQTGHKATWINNAHAWMKSVSGTGAGQLLSMMYYNDALYTSTQSFKIANATAATLSALQAMYQDTSTPTTKKPKPPTSLTASNITPTSFTINWTAPTKYDDGTTNLTPAGYWIYQDGATTHYANPRAATATSSNLSGFVANSTHTFQMSTFDAANVEGAKSSPPLSVTLASITDTQPPTAPVLSSTTGAVSTSPTEVDLNWGASTDTGGSGLAYYRIYRANGSTSTGETLIGQTPDISVAYADITVVAGTQYTYTITAMDGAGNESLHSGSATVTTPMVVDTQPPNPPTGVSVTPGITGAVINWTAATDPSGIAGYGIYLAPAGGEFPTFYGTTTATTFTLPSGTLTQGISYNYFVTAIDNTGLESVHPTVPGVFTTTGTPGPTISSVTGTQIAVSPLSMSIQIAASGTGPLQYWIDSFGSGDITPPITNTTGSFLHNFSDFGDYRLAVRVVDANGAVAKVNQTVSLPDPSGARTFYQSWWKPVKGRSMLASEVDDLLDNIDLDYNTIATKIGLGDAHLYGPAGEIQSYPRLNLGSGVTLTSGSLKLKFRIIQNDVSITTLRSNISTALPASSTVTLFQLCVVLLNTTNDTATVMATTTSDSAPVTAGGDFTETLTTIGTSYQDVNGALFLPKGSYVGFGAMYVGTPSSGNGPTIIGGGGGGVQEMGRGPRLAGIVSGLSSFPAVNSTLSTWSTSVTPGLIYITGY